ncbi:MAG TPA: MATE family efflux transporter [Candidatus Alectryocaccobium stercorigallinarum]|nr:MATE family efflux transporter [Candidatus Alectryocaccobium stercorigallinarum]
MQKVDFENGKVWKNILMTAFPMLIAQVVSLLYNIVDRIYIGRIPEVGTEALGAVGITFPIIILITGFTNMFGMGGAPLFSIELGRGNKVKASAILNTVFRLEIIAALIITAVGEIFASPLLLAFGATEAELVYSLPYLQIYLIGTVFTMLSTGLNPFINAQGYSTIGMITVIVGAAANIGLDPVFMFGLNMGVAGAAIATVISQVISCALVLGFFRSSKNEFPLRKERLLGSGDKDKPASMLPQAGNIIGLGVTPFTMQATNSLVSICCNNVLMNTGGLTYVSVMTVISSVRQILDTPAMAITEGASPVISYNYGARKYKNVLSAIFIMGCIAIGYTALMWFLIEHFPEFFIGIFTSDGALMQTALNPLHLYFFAFIFQALQYTGQTVFKALGEKKFAVFFSIFRKVILVVPLTFMLPYLFGMGTDGVFIAEPISNFVGGTASFVTMLIVIVPRLRHGNVKQK